MILIEYSKLNGGQFIPHLDMLKHLTKIIRRTGISVKYSQGFNPHILIYMSSPIALGLKSVSEYCLLDTDASADGFVEKFNACAPKGIRCVRAFNTDKKVKVASGITSAVYEIKGIPFFDVNEILNGDDKELKKTVLRILNCHRALTNHIFKSTESYGRIYMPFQYIQSDFRNSIRIGNNEELVEIYDIHCCFVYLTSKIIMNKTSDIDLINECKEIILKCDNDIYKEILKFNKVSYKIENRKKFKANVMKWLFSCRKDRYVSINNCTEVFYIDNYFKHSYPLFYSNVIFYKEDTFFKEEDNHIIKEKCSKLPFECFEYEAELMFNNVLPFLHEKYKNIPFISLHDAIFIPKRFIEFETQIKNDIIYIINQK